jgi:hypothetical protein
MRIITTLFDDISKEQKFVESQIKAIEALTLEASATGGERDPSLTSKRLGWVEMAELLDIASHQVSLLVHPLVIPCCCSSSDRRQEELFPRFLQTFPRLE